MLAAKAPHARHRPASTLKVLNALVVRRQLSPDTVVDGTAEDLTIDGSKAGIGPGGHYTVRELLDGLLLNSGNDAAQALARERSAGTRSRSPTWPTWRTSWARWTPARPPRPGWTARAWRPRPTTWRCCSGWPCATSCSRRPSGTQTVPFPGYGDKPGFKLSNSNKLLLRYPGAIGGKAGFTDAARHTLVGAAERDGRRLVVALMRGEQEPVPMWQQAAHAAGLGVRPAGRRDPGRGAGRLGARPGGDRRPWRPPGTKRRAARPARPSPVRWCPLELIAAAAVVAAGGATLALRRRSRR